MNKEEFDNEIITLICDETETKEYISIPRGVYMSRCHQKEGRSKHFHTCIEMTYILSGSAMHAIQLNSGEIIKEKLTIGNYYILDYGASHIIYQTSSDFFLVNLLFHPSFINSSLNKYDSFDNLLKTVFQDIHLSTLEQSVANKTYFDADKKVRQIFENAWETYKLKEPGYRDDLRCYISLILNASTRKILPRKIGKNHAVIAIKDYINEHYMEDISLGKICKERLLNMSYISRKFKELIGVSFETYLQNIRIQNACTLLIDTDDSIDSIIEKVGYRDNRSFRKNFKRVLNTTPLKFRQLHR